jgi:hypothetical protein
MITKGTGVVFLTGWLAFGSPFLAQKPARPSENDSRPLFACDPRLGGLFTPPRPRVGIYEVCTTAAPIAEVADPRWTVEQLAPLDAFGAAGRYDRAALTRLYGGRRAQVARGWIQRGDAYEAITLISPHPNHALTSLEPGTLRIRLIICCP